MLRKLCSLQGVEHSYHIHALSAETTGFMITVVAGACRRNLEGEEREAQAEGQQMRTSEKWKEI